MATKKKKANKAPAKAKKPVTTKNVVGGLFVGLGTAILSRFIIPKIPLNTKLSAGIVTAAGLIMAWKSKNPYVKAAGAGLFIGAGSVMVSALIPSLSGVGIGQTVRFNPQQRRMSGFPQPAAVGQGFPQPAAVGQSFPQPNAVGNISSRMYAGVYG